jgi:hypothetical protein
VRIWFIICVLTVACGGLAFANPEKGAPDKASTFSSRFASLKSNKQHFVVKMKPGDDPSALPMAEAASGTTLVASGRMGIYTPPILSPSDMSAVVNKHMIDIRKCYKKQLAAAPDWADEMILDLAVKKTGRVTEVSVSPGRVKRDVMGQCLMSSVPKWRFPEFTGEVEEGIVQEVVNASFPFSFSVN